MFNAFLSSRAVPATPEERVGASAEHLPDASRLRPLCRGSASSCTLEATSEFAPRYGPRFRSRRIATRQHPGSASAGLLTVSRREPGYPIAQRFIGVGSFHPTRNAPLHGAHKVVLKGHRAVRQAVRVYVGSCPPCGVGRSYGTGSAAARNASEPADQQRTRIPQGTVHAPSRCQPLLAPLVLAAYR